MSKTVIQKIRKKCVLAIAALLPAFGFSQLSITTNTVATTLAQTIVGSGVSVGSASLNCGVHASGTFTDTGVDLGLNNGIILTTGYATDAGGPSVFANYNENTHGVATYSDPALVGIGGANAKYDVCILTFTFVPVCSSINIKYVFGSEEYPKYINSYNDAFGIFLSGPNPSGGNYALTDIATLPDGHNTPVSIDSVNGGYTIADGATAATTITASNPSYYVNNFTYSGTFAVPGNGEISYHGYTIPVTSSASVTPCQTYTMEIAIADGGNGNFDSGVFIEGNSVACTLAPMVSVTTTSSSCGASTGNASVSVTNFDGTETYSWSPGGQTTQSISGLSPGSYTCHVGMICGSTTYTNVIATVTGPTIPTVTVTSTTVCSGSNASITASGTAVTYTWNTGATGATLTIPAATANANYTVTGTSATGCTNTATGNVTVNSLPILTVNSPTICTGSTGTLIAGGANTYTWSTSATTNSISVNPTVLTNYMVTGTDGNGCKNAATATVSVNPLPTISIPNDTICKGFTGTLVANGATTYTWNTGVTGATFTVANINSNATYSVIGTDAATTCTNTTTGNIIVRNVVVNATGATICSGSTATLTASGVNTYTWSTAATTASIIVTPTVTTSYTVIGTDAYGCNSNPAVGTVSVAVAGSNITVTPTKSVACSGVADTLNATGASTYTWTASDGSIISTNGPQFIVTQTATVTYTVTGSLGGSCFATPGYTTVTVSPPVTLNIAATPTNVVCPGNSITLTASGALNYTWTSGITNGVPFVPSSSQTYSVVGMDANGCLGKDSIQVIVNSTLNITATATHSVLCAGTIDTLTAGGGTSYTWTPSVTSISGASNQQVTTATAGTYTVVGALGTCVDSAMVTITNDTPFNIVVSANPSATVCAGNNVVLTANGALTYTWSGGVNNGVPFIPPSIPASQSYVVMGTDANNCTAKDSITLNINPTPTITINATFPSICLGQDSTTLIASGSAIVSYSWSTSATTSSITVSPNSTQIYTVTGIDGNGCLTTGGASTIVNVNTPIPPIINSSSGSSVCSGSPTNLTASGAVTYTWNTGSHANPITINPTSPTTYTVYSTDLNGCKDSTSIPIGINPSPSLPTVTGNTFICSNAPVNNLAVSATNATSYIWIGPAPFTNTVSTSSSPSFTASGIYIIYAVNSCGTSSTTATLTKDSVTATITSPTGIHTTGNAPDTVSFAGHGASTTGIISSTSYNWSFGNGNSSSIQNPSEIYTAPSLSINIYTATLTVTDSKGCSGTDTITITVKEIPTMVIIPNIFSPNGDGINDVFSIKATGISNFDCQIYDRWGILLHEWVGLDGGWDGKGKNGNNETDGTYFYIIKYNDMYNKAINKNGFFELIR